MTVRRKVTGIALTGIAPLALTVLTASPAAAHGSMTDPVSRVSACFAEGPESPKSAACKAAVQAGGTQALYDWNGVRDGNAGGQSRTRIPDGKLCSANSAEYKGLDLPRADWPSSTMRAGSHTFHYKATAPHKGSFELYLTKSSYHPAKPLKWSDLESKPFAKVTDPKLTNGEYVFDGKVPATVRAPSDLQHLAAVGQPGGVLHLLGRRLRKGQRRVRGEARAHRLRAERHPALGGRRQVVDRYGPTRPQRGRDGHAHRCGDAAWRPTPLRRAAVRRPRATPPRPRAAARPSAVSGWRRPVGTAPPPRWPSAAPPSWPWVPGCCSPPPAARPPGTTAESWSCAPAVREATPPPFFISGAASPCCSAVVTGRSAAAAR